jgi:uncharacterized protein YjiS (DUF1127 family)
VQLSGRAETIETELAERGHPIETDRLIYSPITATSKLECHMFNNVKFAVKMAAHRQRARRELADLMQRDDHRLEDLGLSRADVARARSEIRFL